MHAAGLVLRHDREPGEPPRGHVVTPEPNRAARQHYPPAPSARLADAAEYRIAKRGASAAVAA
jgi:hypothetical protein